MRNMQDMFVSELPKHQVGNILVDNINFLFIIFPPEDI